MMYVVEHLKNKILQMSLLGTGVNCIRALI